MATKFLYLFSEGNADMRNLLGGKGANLAEMTNIGMPVPQGFTITTEACTQYYEDGEKINDEIQAQIMEYIDKLEKIYNEMTDYEKSFLTDENVEKLKKYIEKLKEVREAAGEGNDEGEDKDEPDTEGTEGTEGTNGSGGA